ncbi:hypothetical protein B0T26DRAFT_798970 [Lasiosphaeria miniovina]|uniref:Uncharacterized protein n=1 Tax=Lasiosphaeria miniovina TaxID=1954250 RepID=A0AA40B331_9PEZI|nr:uncharacterized protein B0T26DRAFT_798970 [Lasiosphaeria miniovina]KAK0726790.1 hypothetical protein B0T26DRAFT_798970 [Lasiosphaeria miniovina]
MGLSAEASAAAAAWGVFATAALSMAVKFGLWLCGRDTITSTTKAATNAAEAATNNAAAATKAADAATTTAKATDADVKALRDEVAELKQRLEKLEGLLRGASGPQEEDEDKDKARTKLANILYTCSAIKARYFSYFSPS